MSDNNNQDNWLRASLITCPNCHQQLYRVDHSPFDDNHHLYCDKCSNSVEVEFYDPVVMAMHKQVSDQDKVDYTKLMSAIEERLEPCSCGGNFRHNAPRRCHFCLSEVIIDESGVDLWPAYFDLDIDERDPTEDESARANEFLATHVRSGDIWKHE